MDKVAVDEKAKQYWEQYYKEYGKSWVRDIPRRIKAALADNDMVRNAAAGEDISITPVGVVETDNGLLAIEGTYESGGDVFLFCAHLDAQDGSVRDIDQIALVSD